MLVQRGQDRRGRGGGIPLVAAGEQEGELVATEPRDDRRGGQHVAQDVGHELEHLVADTVPAAVVDHLEVVQVEHHHGGYGAPGAGGADPLLEQFVEPPAVHQPGERVVGGQVLQALLAGLQLLAGAIQRQRGRDDLVLHGVEARRHGRNLVASPHVNREDLRPGPGRGQVTAAQGLHRPGEIRQGAALEPLGGLAHLHDGVRDHPGKDQADRDGQQRDGHEDVLQQRDERGLALVHLVDREQVAGAVQRHDQRHGAGELGPERQPRTREASSAAVLPGPPGVGQRPRVSQRQAEQDVLQAELLEPQQRRHRPATGRDQPEADGAARCPPRAGHVRGVSAQQPHRDARHADRDQVGEVGRGDHGRRVAGDQQCQRHRGGQQSRDPGTVEAVAPRPGPGQEAVLGQLRQRPRGARQRLQRPVEHVEDHEPQGGGLGSSAEQRGEGRAQSGRQVAHQGLRAEGAEPHDRQHDEVERGDSRGGEDRAGHLALVVARLAHVARRGLEGRSSEPDQVEPRHGAGDHAERAVEGQGQVESRGPLPVHLAGDHGDDRGHERQGS